MRSTAIVAETEGKCMRIKAVSEEIAITDTYVHSLLDLKFPKLLLFSQVYPQCLCSSLNEYTSNNVLLLPFPS